MTTYTLGDHTYRSHVYSWGQIHAAVRMRVDDAAERAEVVARTGIRLGALDYLYRRLGLVESHSAANRRRHAADRGDDLGARDAEVVRLYVHERLPSPAVAEMVGISDRAVCRTVRRLGHRVRSKSAAMKLHFETAAR